MTKFTSLPPPHTQVAAGRVVRAEPPRRQRRSAARVAPPSARLDPGQTRGGMSGGQQCICCTLVLVVLWQVALWRQYYGSRSYGMGWTDSDYLSGYDYGPASLSDRVADMKGFEWVMNDLQRVLACAPAATCMRGACSARAYLTERSGCRRHSLTATPSAAAT